MKNTGDAGKKGLLIGVASVMLLAVVILVIVIGARSYKQYKEDTRVTDDAGNNEYMNSDSGQLAEADVNDTASVADDINGNTKDNANVEELTSDAYKEALAIDFNELKAICPSVYAYIKVPGTGIDYPIAYCDAKEPFYWNHDIYGNEDEKGMIITDSLNSMDFSEHMTLVYGKDVKDGSMFGELYKFRDEDFFNTHDTVEIYLEDCKLTYTVFAAYIHPNEQILITNDFEDPISFTKYFEKIKEIRDLSAEFREDCMPMYEDYVITLVTHCDDDSKRLFVQAVLKEIEEY